MRRILAVMALAAALPIAGQASAGNGGQPAPPASQAPDGKLLGLVPIYGLAEVEANGDIVIPRRRALPTLDEILGYDLAGALDRSLRNMLSGMPLYGLPEITAEGDIVFHRLGGNPAPDPATRQGKTGS